MSRLEINKLDFTADLSLLRLDLINPDPGVSGNKGFKLKYNLTEAKRSGFDTILTFGGAYSNHIYATAAAAKRENFKSIGIIRGEATKPLNETLTYAAGQGMNLHFISRTSYRNKDDDDFLQGLKQKFGDIYIIPEGGSNALAVKGVAEVIDNIGRHFDLWVLPVGTGGTLAGIIAGLQGQTEVLGISALKGAYNLKENVHAFLKESGTRDPGGWKINHEYHFGGYAKLTEDLYRFILNFKNQQGILLDPIYTGKMMFALYDLHKRGIIPSEKKILAVHTGGLQGWNGMTNRYSFAKAFK